jgi:spermidine synthase
MMDLLIIGLISILGQAVLLRELSVAFYGIELIYVLSMGIWLVWTALGAVIGRRNLSPSSTWIQFFFLLFSLLLPADVVFIRSIRTIFSPVPGAYLPFTHQILAMSAALLPIGLLSGLIFQWAAKLYLVGGRTLARAYALESAGGLAGGLCATLFLRFGLQNLTIAILCALFALSAVLAGREKNRGIRIAAAAAGAMAFILLWRAGPIDRAMTAWTHPNLLATQDTPYCRITVTQQGGQIAVYENDALSFETEGTEAEEFVHMAALMHPRPARVLILGGGIEGTVREILKHAPAQVDYVELNPAMLTMVAPNLPRELQEPLHAPSVRVTVADARRFLRSAGLFDLILIGMPEPDSGQANRFYTREFFEQCAAHLSPDGILAFRLKSAENFWTSQQAGRAVSIYRALRAVLPQVQVLPGGTSIFAASMQPLPKDPALLSSRLEARGISTRFVSAPYIHYLYTNDRYFKISHLLDTESAPLNTDVHPICYQYTLMIWLSKFYPGLAVLDLSSLVAWGRSHQPFLWIVALALPLLFVICGRRPPLRRALLVGIAAFVGMVLETSFVLYYQVKSGILYQDIGILLMGFMAGLALGALVTERHVFARMRGMPRWYGLVLCAGFTLFSMVTSLSIRAGAIDGLAEITGLLLITGFLVAAIFAYASLESDQDQRNMVAPLYAADLIGGCMGSVASTLLLIPIAGLVATAASMAPLALLSILLLRWKGNG